MNSKSCSVSGCRDKAAVEVILYDLYRDGEVFFEQDNTCPHLCRTHMLENEQGAVGERKPRAIIDYPHSNRNGAQGFTIYKPLVGA